MKKTLHLQSKEAVFTKNQDTGVLILWEALLFVCFAPPKAFLNARFAARAWMTFLLFACRRGRDPDNVQLLKAVWPAQRVKHNSVASNGGFIGGTLFP